MTATIEKPQAILFDWDGTLVDSLPGLFAAHNHVRVALGHPAWSWDEYMAEMHLSSRELYPRLYGDRAEEGIAMLFDHYHAIHLDNFEILPQAEELLQTIRAAGIPMALVSNKRHEILLREVAHLGWGHYFEDALVGAGAAAKDKPAADPVHMALQKRGIAPDAGTAWYVGDTVTDMRLAQAIDFKAVLVLNGEDKTPLISEFSPYLVVQDRAHMISILQD